MKNSHEGQNTLKIETIKTQEGDEASYCLERGGIITSLKFRGKEILYLDEETLKNKEVNVKGGIPILFPNAGPVDSPRFPNLKQHGFARDSSNWKTQKVQYGFQESLVPNDKGNISYPYNFILFMQAQFEKNGSFTINQKVENLEDYKELPISMGLHPYFKVPSGEKKNIKFNFEGGKYVEEQFDKWSNGQFISIDNPKIKDPMAKMEIVFPNMHTLIIDPSLEYKKIWVWSMVDKDFICVEPVMRDVGGLANDPQKIRPKEKFSASVNFDIKEV